MNQRVANKINAIAVSAYKFLGSVLLGLIMLGLISFLSVQGFFLVSKGWVTPTVISPVAHHILTLRTRLPPHTSEWDPVLDERGPAEDRRAPAVRVFAAKRTLRRPRQTDRRSDASRFGASTTPPARRSSS